MQARYLLLVPIFFLLALMAAGCASAPKPVAIDLSAFDGRPQAIILDVPFAEQTSILCGPTSLYMVSKKAIPSLTVDQVTALTLSPGASGSYKQDMTAAARRLGLAPYLLHTFGGLIESLSAGTPVVLFHETRFFTKRFWHYSVLTGYNRLSQSVYVHIGPEAYHEMKLSELLPSWEIGGRWAMTVQPPEQIPASASVEEARDNALTFLRLGKLDEAEALGQAMESRWPDRYESQVILADLFGKRREPAKALRHLRVASRLRPDHSELKSLVRQLLHSRHEQYTKRSND